MLNSLCHHKKTNNSLKTDKYLRTICISGCPSKNSCQDYNVRIMSDFAPKILHDLNVILQELLNVILQELPCMILQELPYMILQDVE